MEDQLYWVRLIVVISGRRRKAVGAEVHQVQSRARLRHGCSLPNNRRGSADFDAGNIAAGKLDAHV